MNHGPFGDILMIRTGRGPTVPAIGEQAARGGPGRCPEGGAPYPGRGVVPGDGVSPVVGTAEQAGPKSTAAAPDAGDDAAGEDAGADVAGEEDDDDPLELHAAALRASVTARPEVARRR